MRGIWLTLISQDSASLRVSCENEEGAKGVVSKTTTNDGCCVLEFEERDGTLLTHKFFRQFVLCCRVLEYLSYPLQRGETTVCSSGLKFVFSNPSPPKESAGGFLGWMGSPSVGGGVVGVWQRRLILPL